MPSIKIKTKFWELSDEDLKAKVDRLMFTYMIAFVVNMILSVYKVINEGLTFGNGVLLFGNLFFLLITGIISYSFEAYKRKLQDGKKSN